MIGYVTGIGCAALYYGATAIKALSVIMTVIETLSLVQEVIECATNVVFAIVYGVTGHRTQMAIYAGLATLCLIDILVELGVPGKVRAEGPKGTVEIDVDIVDKKSIEIPSWNGSGPAPGVLGINANSTSNSAIKNYSPKEGIEFVFDATTNTFVVGKNKYNNSWGSPHQKLAQSIDANQGASTTLGGVFSRGPNGEIFTNENSGHFGKNWTSDFRTQFIEIMREYGLEVIHEAW